VNFTGNVVNGTIGKQMVDTLVESASNVEVHIFRLKFETKFLIVLLFLTLVDIEIF